MLPDANLITSPELPQSQTVFFLSIANKIVKMTTPLIGSRLINSLGNFLGMLMAAKLGSDVLAASALINSVMVTVMTTTWSLLFGVCILVGRAHGAKKAEDVGSITRQCLWLGIFSGIPSTALLWNMNHILLLLGQDKHLVAIATQFFHAYAWGVIPSMGVMCFSQMVVGISRPRLTVIWGLIALPLGLLLSYALIFGKFGAPTLGIAGAGYASSISFSFFFILNAVWLGCGKRYKQYRIFNTKSWQEWFRFNHLRELLSFGWFTSVQISAEFLAFGFSTVMIGWFGAQALAAQQIVMQISMLILVIPIAMSQSSGVLISHAFGAKKFGEIRSIGHVILAMGALVGIVFALFYCLFPKFIISFYLDPSLPSNAATVHLAVVLLTIAAVSQFFDILRTIATGALRGLYDAKVPMFVSVFISCLTSLPIGYVLGTYFHLGAVGVRLGFVASFLLGAIILVRRLHRLSCPKLLGTAN